MFLLEYLHTVVINTLFDNYYIHYVSAIYCIGFDKGLVLTVVVL